MVKMKDKFEIKWDRRAGPILLIKLGKRKFGLAFCHRLENRSFKVFGHVMPICARCTGQIIGFIVFLIIYHLNLTLPPILASILILPLLLDGFSQLFTLRKSNNALRFITGIIFALGLSSLMVVLS